MHDFNALCDLLFPAGHTVKADGLVVHGTGLTSEHQDVAVIGTRDHAAIGVDLAFELSTLVLEVVQNHPGRPILMLVDTQGQHLAKRDELLGNCGYLAHLSKAFELARQRGHKLVSLVYGEAVSGGYLALGMIADGCYAVSDAMIRVMALPAMSRITQIPVDRLEELCRTSPIFGPGVHNYEQLGALDGVWDKDLDVQLVRALAAPPMGDQRAINGLARGGRTMAQQVIDQVLATPSS